jgi:hypothetical protein
MVSSGCCLQTLDLHAFRYLVRCVFGLNVYTLAPLRVVFGKHHAPANSKLSRWF